MHPLLVEQGYFAISGKLLHSHEILKFLDYPNPTISLRNYSLARSITKIDVATGELAYKGIYKFTVMRKILSVLFVTSYFLFALLSFTPLILGSYVGITSSISSLALTLGFLISFMIIAIVALLCFIKIQAANTLLEQQNLVHNTRDPK